MYKVICPILNSGVTASLGSSLQALIINKKQIIVIDFFKQNIFNSEFEKLALEIFYFQSKNNDVYSKFLNYLNIKEGEINEISKIPFLPIEFFKSELVSSAKNLKYNSVFQSSSTSGKGISSHYVYDIDFYNLVTQKCFSYFFGDIGIYTFRFLLPSYLERKNSSLVFMAENFLKISGKGGFYLNDYDKLVFDLKQDMKSDAKTVLLGVSFALQEFAEKYEIDLSEAIVMETGGMKGKRKEITRAELHNILKKRLNTNKIYSEYGMTELFSQAYSNSSGIFECVPWMKIFISELNDPFAFQKTGKTGRINIIDLANIYTCCFISTDDIGRKNSDNTFEVLGRVDNSDIRGCSLLFD